MYKTIIIAITILLIGCSGKIKVQMPDSKQKIDIGDSRHEVMFKLGIDSSIENLFIRVCEARWKDNEDETNKCVNDKLDTIINSYSAYINQKKNNG